MIETPPPRMIAYPPRLMKSAEAAQYLGMSETRLREVGPSPRRVGRWVVYDRQDLDRWADRLCDLPLDEKDEESEARDVERRFLEEMERGRG